MSAPDLSIDQRLALRTAATRLPSSPPGYRGWLVWVAFECRSAASRSADPRRPAVALACSRVDRMVVASLSRGRPGDDPGKLKGRAGRGCRCEHGGVTDIPSAGSFPISMVTGDPVARVAADATVADVARAIVAADVGAIVVGDDERPAALLSERDVVRVVAAGKDPASVRALEVASTKLVWCDADATIDEVAVRMMDRYIRHVLVERDGALVGIVSARDLLGVYCAEADLGFGSA